MAEKLVTLMKVMDFLTEIMMTVIVTGMYVDAQREEREKKERKEQKRIEAENWETGNKRAEKGGEGI